MKLTKDEVKHVAKLANLPITPEEEEKYTEQLSKILEYVDQLNKVNTTGIEPTFNVSSNENISAEDQTNTSLTQEEVLSNTAKKENGFFVTKGVFNEG